MRLRKEFAEKRKNIYTLVVFCDIIYNSGMQIDVVESHLSKCCFFALHDRIYGRSSKT